MWLQLSTGRSYDDGSSPIRFRHGCCTAAKASSCHWQLAVTTDGSTDHQCTCRCTSKSKPNGSWAALLFSFRHLNLPKFPLLTMAGYNAKHHNVLEDELRLWTPSDPLIRAYADSQGTASSSSFLEMERKRLRRRSTPVCSFLRALLPALA